VWYKNTFVKHLKMFYLCYLLNIEIIDDVVQFLKYCHYIDLAQLPITLRYLPELFTSKVSILLIFY